MTPCKYDMRTTRGAMQRINLDAERKALVMCMYCLNLIFYWEAANLSLSDRSPALYKYGAKAVWTVVLKRNAATHIIGV